MTPTDSPDGAFGAFGAIFVLVLVVGVFISIVRYRATKSLMKSKGASDEEATTVALFGGDNAVAAAALIPKPADPPVKNTASRLAAVDELFRTGAITEEEHAAKRKAILDEI